MWSTVSGICALEILWGWMEEEFCGLLGGVDRYKKRSTAGERTETGHKVEKDDC